MYTSYFIPFSSFSYDCAFGFNGLGDLFYDRILGLGFSWVSCYNDSPQSSKAGVWKVFVSLQATSNCAESGVAGIFFFFFLSMGLSVLYSRSG
jgi:hypothetical protein